MFDFQCLSHFIRITRLFHTNTFRSCTVTLCCKKYKFAISVFCSATYQADLRQSESIDAVFDEVLAKPVNEFKMALMSDVTVRPRPQVARKSVDPFGLIKSIIKSDGQVEYVSIDAASRFKF